MGFTLTIVAIILLVALLLVVRRGHSGAKATAKKSPATATPKEISTEFHAVSIRFKAGACAAAKMLAEERYLSSEAPKLPLEGCDSASCECRFVHHKDRRSGEDRRNPYGGMTGGGTGSFPQERRDAKERRAEPPDDPF